MEATVKKYKISAEQAITERASTGWLMKWTNGKIWLKSSGYMLNQYLWDGYAEVIASAVAKDLGIENYLEYRPCVLNVDGTKVFGCESNDYNIAGKKEFTIDKLIRLNKLDKKMYIGQAGYEQLIKEIKEKFNLDIREYLEDILILDAIILNTDRNLWNMSIMLDKNLQGHICKTYDSGSSMGLTSFNEGEFEEKYMYGTGVKAVPFNNEFDEQVKYVRNNRVYNGGELKNTDMVIKFFRQHFTEENNTYGVVNPLTQKQLDYVADLIIKRYRTVVVNKGWIT